MSFPQYPTYKASGVEWLGNVPEHWEVQRLRAVAVFSGGGTPSREEPAYWNGAIPWVTPKDMKVERIRETEECITPAGVSNSAALVVPPNAVLVVVRSGILKHTIPVAINVVPVATNQDMKALSFDESACLPEFFLRWVQGLNGYLLLTWGKQGATVESIEHGCLVNSLVPLPPVEEQHVIVAFLDHETAKIDALIAEQERLIELLQEKRQAVISHAVTKGLNPDAPMKSSGVEWLGDVPAHWEVGPVKRWLKSRSPERVPLSTEERGRRQGEYPYFGASGIIDYVDDYLFDDTLVLVSEDGANLLNRSTPIAFTATGRYWVNNHAHVLAAPDDHASYWASRIESMDLSPFITGSAQPKLTNDALMNLQIAVPCTSAEKGLIAEYIETAALQLDGLVAESHDIVRILSERRVTLISAAVTGQIDVRDLATEAAA